MKKIIYGTLVFGLLLVTNMLIGGSNLSATAVTYPEPITPGTTYNDVFPSYSLADKVSATLGENPTDEVTQAELESVTELIGIEGTNDLTGMEYLTNLTKLVYTDTSSITASNEQVDTRSVSGLDLTPLAGLTNLTYIDLLGKRITDISPLTGLTNLTYLDLGFCSGITDISALSNLTNLTYLNLYGNQIVDASPLTNLTNLEYVEISYNGLTDTEGLGNKPNMIYLGTASNDITDISGLSGDTGLEILDLSYNSIESIEVIGSLTNIEKLYLQSNNISDISNLSSLNKLLWLDVSYNNISDISVVEEMPKLEIFGFDENHVSDITPLETVASNPEFVSTGQNQTIAVDIPASKVMTTPINSFGTVEYTFAENDVYDPATRTITFDSVTPANGQYVFTFNEYIVSPITAGNAQINYTGTVTGTLQASGTTAPDTGVTEPTVNPTVTPTDTVTTTGTITDTGITDIIVIIFALISVSTMYYVIRYNLK